MSARPAPALRSVAALTALELRLAARRGENILVTLVIPVAVLLFFGGTSVVSFDGPAARTLVPGTIALGIIAAGLVNLGIATAYERHYGVLKRLGGAPLPNGAFLAAKLAAVLVLEVLQVVLLVGIAAAVFGWAPGPAWSPALLVLVVLLGTAAFVGLGLLLAGALRAEAVLALANGLFLGFLLLGGVIVAVEQLPAFLRPVAAFLPSAALVDLLRFALDSGVTSPIPDPGPPLAILGAWTVGAAAVVARTFRWD